MPHIEWSTALTHARLMCISREKAIIRAATALGWAASISTAASTSPRARQPALHRGRYANGVAAGLDRPRRARLCSDERQRGQGEPVAARPGPLPAEDQRSGHFRLRRHPADSLKRGRPPSARAAWRAPFSTSSFSVEQLESPGRQRRPAARRASTRNSSNRSPPLHPPRPLLPKLSPRMINDT